MSYKQIFKRIAKGISTVRPYCQLGNTYWRPLPRPEFERGEEVRVAGPMVVEAGPSPSTLRVRRRAPRGGRRKDLRRRRREDATRREREIATRRATEECSRQREANRLAQQRGLRIETLLRENPGTLHCRCGLLSRRHCLAG